MFTPSIVDLSVNIRQDTKITRARDRLSSTEVSDEAFKYNSVHEGVDSFHTLQVTNTGLGQVQGRLNAMPSESSEPHPQIGVNSLAKYRDGHHVPSEIRNIMRLARIVTRLDLPKQLKPSADRVVADLSSHAG